jgi:hypothetical protein
MSEPDKFVLIEDVAKHLQVSVATVRAWVRNSIIPKDTYLKIGHTYRFNLVKVLDALTKYDEDADSSSQKDPNQLEFDFNSADKHA